ncbi:unnamed protein product [Hermetia illucens]|uniref:Uncharacterized protein n=1 Tax=Hermetia illucens TaxID=343691 RepID=A0A7R8UTH6_HERIL|nr:unnamed protein product [Hermetia illucens]
MQNYEGHFIRQKQPKSDKSEFYRFPQISNVIKLCLCRECRRPASGIRRTRRDYAFITSNRRDIYNHSHHDILFWNNGNVSNLV